MDENQNKTENAAPVETQGKKKSKKAPIIIVAVIVAVCFLLPVILGVCAAIFTSTEKWYVSYVTNDDGTCSVGRYVRDPEQGFIRNLVFENGRLHLWRTHRDRRYDVYRSHHLGKRR